MTTFVNQNNKINYKKEYYFADLFGNRAFTCAKLHLHHFFDGHFLQNVSSDTLLCNTV